MRFTLDIISVIGVASLLSQAAAAPLETRAPQEPAPTGGSFLSGITSLFGNLGGHTPGNGAAYAQNSGGTGGFLADVQVPLDHVKFTMNPASAEQKIPAAQNSQMREGHRMAHEAIYKGLGGSNDAGELKN